jgi:hypothetical protein
MMTTGNGGADIDSSVLDGQRVGLARAGRSANQLQHPEREGAGLGGADPAEPQPQPEPPADFTSASRAQQAAAPLGAAPPQQALGVDAAGLVGDVTVAAVVDIVASSIRGRVCRGPQC